MNKFLKFERPRSHLGRCAACVKQALELASDVRLAIGRKLDAAEQIRKLIARHKHHEVHFGDSKEEAERIQKQIARGECLLWSDLLVFEAGLIRLRSPLELRNELPRLRHEYRELVGLETYEELKLPIVNLASAVTG